ncbi:MAG: winged helix-turn-helix transcriptional regulator [Marinifilaceae bacterium]
MEKGICPIDTFINVVKGKRKATIILHLMQGTKRYNELIRLLPDISDRMLSRQLKELEQDGIILRKVFPEVPPKVEYSLSELGKKVHPVLIAMFKSGRTFEKRME